MKGECRMNSRCKRFWGYLLIHLLIFNMSGAGPALASCIDLADIPLEIAHIQGPPGLIFFAVDNSQSMDYELMTDNLDTQGLLQDHANAGITCTDITNYDPASNQLQYGYEYIFNGSAPNATYDTLDKSVNDKYIWQARWSGYNKIYYNPSMRYDPWPRWVEVANINPNQTPYPPTAAEQPYAPNAHADTPRLDPKLTNYTFNLNATWATLQYVTAASEIIADVAATGDVIVDEDFDADNNDEFARTGEWAPVAAYNGTYNSDYIHTSSSTAHTAKWKTALDPTTRYHAYTRWRAMENRDIAVTYSIRNNGIEIANKIVNQEINGDRWNLLASDLYFPSGTAEVYVNHFNKNDLTDRFCADAIRFVKACGTNSVNIVYRHYWVKNDKGIFLVNLNGAFDYYRFIDGDNDGRVDNCELVRLSASEASAAGIVSGRSYSEEKRNFANWFQFYRKRAFTIRYAMSLLVTQMSNVYVGFITVPEADNVGLRAINVDFAGQQLDNSTDFLLTIYNMGAPGSNSPLRKGLNKVGGLFDGSNSALITAADKQLLSQFTVDPATSADYYPFFTAAKGGECQQAFAIVLTDGAQDFTGPDIGNTDKGDASDPFDSEFDGGKYADSYEDTLADVAMEFYEKDLRTGLADYVPVNDLDAARHQHMVTYGLAFGVHGNINPEIYPDCPAATSNDTADCPVWPEPVGGYGMLDDLYHATVNGRGVFLNAANPKELISALLKIRSDIEFRLGSGSAVTTNAVQRQIGAKIYQGIYHSGSWWGTLLSKPVNVDTGAVGDAEWDAKNMLAQKSWNNRTIFTINPANGTGIPFRYASLNADQQAALNSKPELVDYLRGNNQLEEWNGGLLRNRDGKLGDIVHSEPFYHNNAIYIGANDGMLHAFSAETGDELFAYVPSLVYPNLASLASTDYLHKYFVDATPYARTVSGGRDLLASGLAKGGKGVFCLDVTDALTASEANAANFVKWEYTAAGDDDLGYVFGQAYVAETAAGWTVIFANGYDSINQKAILYILNAADGSIVRKIDTGAAGCNGLSSPTLIDPDFDGLVDYVYAGDLKGNLWKFDLRSSDSANWNAAYNDGSNPKPLFTAVNASGEVQPITVEPDVMEHCQKGIAGYLVAFGTGQYLNEADLSDTRVQSFYGIYDWGRDWVIKAAGDETIDDLKYLGAFTPARTLSNVADVTLLQQTVAFSDADYVVVTDNYVNYYNPYTEIGDHAGWYFNLPTAGERVVEDPLILNGNVVFVSNIPESAPCAAGGSSVLYQLDGCNGGRPDKSQFDTNGDGKYDENDKIDIGNGETANVSGKKVDAMLYAPVELGDHLYINDATGQIWDTPIPENPAKMSYWWLIE